MGTEETSRGREAQQVTAELGADLRTLRATVKDLTAVLLPPEADASRERLATP